MSHLPKGAIRITTALALAAMATGCAHVKQDEFQAEMDNLRAEIASGDQALETRIAANESSINSLQTRMDRLESELDQLGQEFDATVQRLETALRFAAPVHFGFDEATVRQQDYEVLNRFASVVQKNYPGAVITVEGFTDPAGSAAYNKKLGQRRADAVKAVLVDQGRMMGDQIRTVSYGEDTSRLVDAGAMGPGETGMANRRVVMVIEQADADMARPVVSDDDATVTTTSTAASGGSR